MAGRRASDSDRDTERRAEWMTTFTGRQFHPFDPKPEDICIQDIAHALAMQCRYSGHSKYFYSIAEHSILLCQYLTIIRPDEPWHQLQALMHDAAEAYLSDIVRPVKRFMYGYSEIEQNVEAAIQDAFGLYCCGKTPEIDVADGLILYDEARVLFDVIPDDWHMSFAPGLDKPEITIHGWNPAQAEAIFLEAFYQRAEIL
jgi:hypothetical protein